MSKLKNAEEGIPTSEPRFRHLLPEDFLTSFENQNNWLSIKTKNAEEGIRTPEPTKGLDSSSVEFYGRVIGFRLITQRTWVQRVWPLRYLCIIPEENKEMVYKSYFLLKIVSIISSLALLFARVSRAWPDASRRG